MTYSFWLNLVERWFAELTTRKLRRSAHRGVAELPCRNSCHLATVLHDQGHLDIARSLHQRALTILETRLGSDNPATVRSREPLAAVVAALENRSMAD